MSIFLIFADQLSKYTVKHPFINTAFAFSLPLPKIAIYAIYMVVLGLIGSYILTKHKNFLGREKLAWVFILSGAVSNIAERVLLGYVRDWIYILNGVFNLADFFIIFGMLVLFYPSKLKNKLI